MKPPRSRSTSSHLDGRRRRCQWLPFAALLSLFAVQGTVAKELPPPPNPPATPLSTADEITKLNELSQWGSFSQFKSYMVMLPQHNLDLKRAVATKAAETVAAGKTQFPWSPYGASNLSIRFKVTSHPVPPGLPHQFVGTYNTTQLAMFDQAHGGDPRDAICMILDGFGTPVYLPVAERFEAGFIRGLVTRLILGQYFREWQRPDTDLNFSIAAPPLPDVSSIVPVIMSPPIPLPPVYIGPDAAAPPIVTITNEVWEPNQPLDQSMFWYATTMPSPPMLTFHMFMGIEAYFHPVEPASLMWGWRAGEELDSLRGKPDDHYRRDVVQLIESRFSPYDLGRLVGFTLNYLHGFVDNQRVQSFATLSVQPPTPNLQTIGVVLNSTPAGHGTDGLLSDFERALTLEIYGLSQSRKDKGHQQLGVALAFLDGFEAGTLHASDILYKSITQVAYGAGFLNGWRYGYEQGYAAGFNVGYNQGYGQAWAKASLMLKQVQQSAQQSNGSDAQQWISVGLDVGTAIISML